VGPDFLGTLSLRSRPTLSPFHVPSERAYEAIPSPSATPSEKEFPIFSWRRKKLVTDVKLGGYNRRGSVFYGRSRPHSLRGF